MAYVFVTLVVCLCVFGIIEMSRPSACFLDARTATEQTTEAHMETTTQLPAEYPPDHVFTPDDEDYVPGDVTTADIKLITDYQSYDDMITKFLEERRRKNNPKFAPLLRAKYNAIDEAHMRLSRFYNSSPVDSLVDSNDKSD